MWYLSCRGSEFSGHIYIWENAQLGYFLIRSKALTDSSPNSRETFVTYLKASLKIDAANLLRTSHILYTGTFAPPLKVARRRYERIPGRI